MWQLNFVKFGNPYQILGCNDFGFCFDWEHGLCRKDFINWWFRVLFFTPLSSLGHTITFIFSIIHGFWNFFSHKLLEQDSRLRGLSTQIEQDMKETKEKNKRGNQFCSFSTRIKQNWNMIRDLRFQQQRKTILQFQQQLGHDFMILRLKKNWKRMITNVMVLWEELWRKTKKNWNKYDAVKLGFEEKLIWVSKLSPSLFILMILKQTKK